MPPLTRTPRLLSPYLHLATTEQRAKCNGAETPMNFSLVATSTSSAMASTWGQPPSTRRSTVSLKLNSGPTYRHWYPNGKSFWNTSIDYGYVSNRLNIKGETATGNCHEVATINTISYSLNSQLSLMALQRYYPYRYFSLYAESFSEGGTTNDESGVFVGGKWTPWRNAELQLYTDISYFAWPKYGVSTSSHRWDNFIQAATTGKTWSFLARYRLKMKENDNSDKTALIKSYTHHGRIATSYTSKVWMWKAQTDMSYVSGETNKLWLHAVDKPLLAMAMAENHRFGRLFPY